jgi:two-component system, chemotaxis family, protein-glutamate methylesterase/glutaminase
MSTVQLIRVLIAEDSLTVRRHLARIIDETPGMMVVGEASDGEEALEMAQNLKPDVISMDIKMPRVDGLEATRRLMSRQPTPVVIVTGLVEQDIDLSFQAVQAGALALVEKPPARSAPDFSSKQRQLVNTLFAMSQVRLVRRWENAPGYNGDEAPFVLQTTRLRPPPELVAIGASAGGPTALAMLLKGLPSDFPLPIVVAQHIPQEFVAGMARWLDATTPLIVRVATDGHALEPGVVHLSPGSAHTAVARQGRRFITQLIQKQGTYRHQPSVDVLFASVAKAAGASGIGVILTGMGDDGAEGLLAMRQAGARTFAQDEASCTVFGMPGAAIECGAVERVLPLSHLSAAIVKVL